MADVDEPDILPADPDLGTSPSQMQGPHRRAVVSSLSTQVWIASR